MQPDLASGLLLQSQTLGLASSGALLGVVFLLSTIKAPCIFMWTRFWKREFSQCKVAVLSSLRFVKVKLYSASSQCLAVRSTDPNYRLYKYAITIRHPWHLFRWSKIILVFWLYWTPCLILPDPVFWLHFLYVVYFMYRQMPLFCELKLIRNLWTVQVVHRSVIIQSHGCQETVYSLWFLVHTAYISIMEYICFLFIYSSSGWILIPYSYHL